MSSPFLAQSLIEYSAISGMIASVSSAFSSAEDWVLRQNPQVLIAVGIVLALFVVARAFRPPTKF